MDIENVRVGVRIMCYVIGGGLVGVVILILLSRFR